jgi:coatomer subunit beta'
MQAMVKSFETADVPVRCAKFVARKQWVATGSDDMLIRVHNYNTMDREKTFEAHADYIRSIAVHPTLPYLLSCSDDMCIKLWDWDKGWKCTQVFEGHVHYVMQVCFFLSMGGDCITLSICLSSDYVRQKGHAFHPMQAPLSPLGP